MKGPLGEQSWTSSKIRLGVCLNCKKADNANFPSTPVTHYTSMTQRTNRRMRSEEDSQRGDPKQNIKKEKASLVSRGKRGSCHEREYIS